MNTKPIKITSHKNEATYAFGEYRIYTERKSSGCYPQKRRNWTDVSITHRTLNGSHCGFSSIKHAVEAIQKGTVKLYAF